MIRTIIRQKFLILILVLGLGILALVACGSKTSSTSPANAGYGEELPRSWQTYYSPNPEPLRSRS